MLSNFLTEDLFKMGIAVSPLGQPWRRGAGGAVSSSPQGASPQTFIGGGWGAPALPSLRPVFPQSYLHTYKYGNTIYLNLWEHLQQVSDNQAPCSHRVGVLRCPKSLGVAHVY